MEFKIIRADTQSVKKNRAKVLCVASLALLFTFHLSSSLAQGFDAGRPSPEADQKQEVSRIDLGILARDLIGNRVQSNRGDELGAVSDLLIDRRLGRLDYVVVVSGGFAKLGRKLRPVPPGVLSTATAKRGVVAADVSPERWKNAPAVGRASLPKLGDADTSRGIYGYYGQTWPSQTALGNAKSRPAVARSNSKSLLVPGSSLIGRELLDAQGRKFARISDLLLDPGNPQMTFAIIKPQAAPSASDPSAAQQLFAVPLKDLNEVAGSERLIVEATAAQFQQAQPMERGSWTTATEAGATAIYRYRPGEPSDSHTSSVLSRQ